MTKGMMPFRIPIHREGWPFIGFAFVLNFLIWLFSPVAGLVFLAVTLWVVAFFRDPERTPPPGDELLVSPADGRILPIVQAVPPEELGMGVIPMTRISIFMNVFNVHVNRAPCDGTVTKLAYRPGKFFNAAFDKASADNERMSIRLNVPGPGGTRGRDIAFVQIAGLIARRIVCDIKEGQRLCRADRFGIIRFGSRLDVYLPEGVTVLAREGRTVRAGESVLASFQS